MKFFVLALALLLEQAWPLRRGNPLYAAYERYADSLEQRFNGLQASHGTIAWLLAVLPLALVTIIIYALLREANALLALAWSVAVLYIAMGFRRFSHCFTEIAQALREQDIATARDVLGRWRGVPADELNAAEISRVAIELGLLTPQFGMVVFAMKSSLPEHIRIEDIFAGTLPFFLMLLGVLAMIIAFPQISLFIPSILIG